MAVELGLRERKKQQTRRAIYEAAARLFAERGFDAVTVTDIARAADVSEVTVFNYFPTKEDLFFGGMDFFEEQLLEGVRRRPAGESALAAFRRLLLGSAGHLAEEGRAAMIRGAAGLIGASPALQAREREIVARYTQQLAELLAQEEGAGGDEVEAYAVASALMGLHRALVGQVRAAVIGGKRGARLAADFRARARRGFARLEGGLGDYAIHHHDPEGTGDLVLDIGGDVGALVVQTRGDRLGTEIEISRQGAESERTHNVVRERRVGGRPAFAAVFPDLPAGEYRIWTDDPDLPSRASIAGGQVTEVDWR